MKSPTTTTINPFRAKTQNILWRLGQYHGWCPGCLHCYDINSHGIDSGLILGLCQANDGVTLLRYLSLAGHHPRISPVTMKQAFSTRMDFTTCAIIVLKSKRKGKYFLCLLSINSAQQRWRHWLGNTSPLVAVGGLVQEPRVGEERNSLLWGINWSFGGSVLIWYKDTNANNWSNLWWMKYVWSSQS